ncbi:hypothetical protein EGT07_22650 [Herbaspirillum sp. HC18]|nr:hypothetical protein EGT07_22650 [Herbaspirillum sp. HC18]
MFTGSAGKLCAGDSRADGMQPTYRSAPTLACFSNVEKPAGNANWTLGLRCTAHASRKSAYGPVASRAKCGEATIFPVAEIDALDAKEIGKVSMAGVASAVVNAVWRATGWCMRDRPITIDKQLEDADERPGTM